MLNYTQLHAIELNIDSDMATLTVVIYIVCSRSEIGQTVNNNEREILNSKIGCEYQYKRTTHSYITFVSD